MHKNDNSPQTICIRLILVLSVDLTCGNFYVKRNISCRLMIFYGFNVFYWNNFVSEFLCFTIGVKKSDIPACLSNLMGITSYYITLKLVPKMLSIELSNKSQI